MNEPAATPASSVEFSEQCAALASWATGVSWSDLPDTVRRRAAIVLADDLAAMVAAREDGECARLVAQMLATGGPAQSTIFDGTGTRSDRYTVAAANAAAGTWCELDEGYRRAICHAGIYVLPALLAESEATGASARELLRSLAVAYEVVTRIARALPGFTRHQHPHGSLSAVGAAVAVALLRKVDASMLHCTLNTASCMVTPMPFTQVFGGAMVRNVAAALGASNGMRAADWAPLGVTALSSAPVDVFAGAFGADVDGRALLDGLGEDWAVLSNFQKMHACCQFGHSTIEATLELLHELPPGRNVDDLERIVVNIHPLGLKLDAVAPTTTLGARFSMQHMAAATALLGHAGVAAFSRECVTDPRVTALRERVQLRPYEPEPVPPLDRPARVTWRFNDGSERSAHCVSARGEPGRPFTEEEIVRKVKGICAPVYPGLASVTDSLLAGEADVLALPWRTVVARL